VDDGVEPRGLVRLVGEAARQLPVGTEVRLLEHVVDAVPVDEHSGDDAAKPPVVAVEQTLEAAALRRRRGHGAFARHTLERKRRLAAHALLNAAGPRIVRSRYRPLRSWVAAADAQPSAVSLASKEAHRQRETRDDRHDRIRSAG